MAIVFRVKNTQLEYPLKKHPAMDVFQSKSDDESVWENRSFFDDNDAILDRI
jgi:hypothetical protein